MAFRKHDGTPEKVTFDMTPMIDCCFQLIIFFMLSLKLLSPEGDFNIRMPLAAPSEGMPEPDQLPPMKVRLTAGAGGRLEGIQLGNRRLASFAELRRQVRDLVGDHPGPSALQSTEVELDCDYNLDYEYVIRAITAVSGYTDSEGHIIRLVEKIKFAPPRRPG